MEEVARVHKRDWLIRLKPDNHLTLFTVIIPTICGLRKPGNEPNTLVIPIITPANLGAMSSKFTA